MRVLIATDDLTFNPSLVEAYLGRGHEVTVGMANFRLRLGNYDLVHLHWPEELLGWQSCNQSGRKERALEILDWWSERTFLTATVHNLVPHSTERMDGCEAVYFFEFYRRMHRIGHFSDYSFERYAELYDGLPSEKQFVHGLNDFAHLHRFARGREAARRVFGWPEGAMIFGVVGAMRKASEAQLLRDAWRLFGDTDARLILASNPTSAGLPLHRKMADRLDHRMWLRDKRIVSIGGNLDDPDLVAVIEASDAIIIPRLGMHLNSGLLPLAMTFGTAVVAPDYGVFREVLAGSDNALYRLGDAAGLAAGLARQTRENSDGVRCRNLAMARDWGWPFILESSSEQIPGL